MKLLNEKGQAVYYNAVEKHGVTRFVVKAASGQFLLGRDKEPVKSRSFAKEMTAEKYLRRHGYTIV